MVSRANAVFDASGALADQKIAEQLRSFLQGFVVFVEPRRS
jgi:hypothetical protein